VVGEAERLQCFTDEVVDESFITVRFSIAEDVEALVVVSEASSESSGDVLCFTQGGVASDV